MQRLVQRASPGQKEYLEVSGSQQDAVSPAEAAVHNEQSYKALRYLFVGTILGMTGGLYSTYLSICYTRTYGRQVNMEGVPFPSGNAYWPPSVSNMVSDPDSPAGKVWLAMMTTSSFLTVASWYPYQLQNVWVGEHVPLFPCLPTMCFPRISMATARTFLPPIGMLFVTLCHTEAYNMDDPGHVATRILHTGGAMMWIGVTLYVEVYTLASSKIVKIHPVERNLRWAAVILSLFASVLYLLTSSFPAATVGLCCDDEYRDITDKTIETALANGAFTVVAKDRYLMEQKLFVPDAAPPLYQGLYNTAYGKGLIWKRLEFWSECCAGGFMLVDLFIIWFYAIERKSATHSDDLPPLA